MRNLPAVIIITAYNEEQNIGDLLDALCEIPAEWIQKIIVVSASQDRTNSITKIKSGDDDRIALIVEPTRHGLAKTYNNLSTYFEELGVTPSYLVFVSADIFPLPGAVEKLLEAFSDATIAATSGRPLAVNDSKSRSGRLSLLIWDLHHAVSVRKLKMDGNLFAVRAELFPKIPEDIIAPDAFIQYSLETRGFRCKYVRDARVLIMGPRSFRDHLLQRSRHEHAFAQLRKQYGYVPPTKRIYFKPFAYRTVWKHLREDILLALYASTVYLLGKIIGYFDFARNVNQATWKITFTTKVPIKDFLSIKYDAPEDGFPETQESSAASP